MSRARSRVRSCVALTSVSVIFCLAPSAKAIDVFLDWTGFEATIDLGWAAAGWTGAGDGLTASDYLFFKSEVKSRMAGHFSGFTLGLFETAPAGVHEIIHFGSTTTSPGLLGRAERLDWRNRFKDDIADLYLANFGFIAPKASYTRPVALDRLANGIVGTASHELGHNVGLQHYDAYGQDTIKAPAYGGITGQQNDSIMATGSTGLTGTRRGEPRSFNPLELLKLEYADGLAPTLGVTGTELGGANGSIGTAQLIFGTPLPISGRFAVNIDGGISTGSDEDFYRIESATGTLITANIFSAFWEGNPADTIITLYDDTGAVLVTNDDISFSGNSFMTGAGFYSLDSLILNYEATYTGVYYISVSSFGTDTGGYELLVSGLSPVPEPATFIALGIGLAVLVRKRRKR